MKNVRNRRIFPHNPRPLAWRSDQLEWKYFCCSARAFLRTMENSKRYLVETDGGAFLPKWFSSRRLSPSSKHTQAASKGMLACCCWCFLIFSRLPLLFRSLAIWNHLQSTVNFRLCFLTTRWLLIKKLEGERGTNRLPFHRHRHS